MNPLVVYDQASTKWIGSLLAEGGLDFLELSGGIPSDTSARPAYFRIPGLNSRAVKIASVLAGRGCRIVNDPRKRLDTIGRNDYYRTLRCAGLRAPFSIASPTRRHIEFAIEAGVLRYPFILRSMEGLNGQEISLVSGETQMGPLLERYLASGWRFMACEYINTKSHGIFRKWRAYVFGGRVDMWEAGCAREWIVNLAHNQNFDPNVFRAENARGAWPLRWNVMATKAAEALELDVCAFDILADISEPSVPVFVDANVAYGMTAELLPMALFPDDVRHIRAGHYSRLKSWLSS
jgi:glutathione synthase/RimK-type ligase-like ATP-grasp enzyme